MADTSGKKTTTKRTTKKSTAAKTKAASSSKPKVEPEVANGTAQAKEKFSRALEEAKAGAVALGDEAKARADVYREQARERSGDLATDAKAYGEEAKARAADLARDGKSAVSDGMSSLGKVVADNAATIDEKLGARYGDYARQASRSLQENAAKLEAKELEEIGEDAREFVRKSPGLAVGIAAVAGFMIARLFRSGR